MNTTKLILIIGFVYISLVQKKNSTRNMMLLLTGLLAFCMLDLKEGYCTLPATLQDPGRVASCVEVVNTSGEVAQTNTCTLTAAGSSTCNSIATIANTCVYVPAGDLAYDSTDGITGITGNIISHIAKCVGGTDEATLNALGDAKCIAPAASDLTPADLGGCPAADTTATPVTTACNAPDTHAPPWECEDGKTKIPDPEAQGIYYQSPTVDDPASVATDFWKNACCRDDAVQCPPAVTGVILDEDLHRQYKLACENDVKDFAEVVADTSYDLEGQAVSDYGGGDPTKTINENCKYAYGWKYCMNMNEDDGVDFWVGAACVPP